MPTAPPTTASTPTGGRDVEVAEEASETTTRPVETMSEVRARGCMECGTLVDVCGACGGLGGREEGEWRERARVGE